MALVVEDGSIVSGADSYVTLAAFQAYGAARGWTLGATDDADEINLRRAFDAINRNWEYLGEQVNVATQPGAFPRYIVKNRWEYVTPADSVPQAVKDAQCEMAYLILGGADPMATLDGVVASTRSKVGPIEKEVQYQGGKGTPRYLAVERLLRPYLIGGAGSLRLVRA